MSLRSSSEHRRTRGGVEEDVRSDWFKAHHHPHLPSRCFPFVSSLPRTLHPMAQLQIGATLLSEKSKFTELYSSEAGLLK